MEHEEEFIVVTDSVTDYYRFQDWYFPGKKLAPLLSKWKQLHKIPRLNRGLHPQWFREMCRKHPKEYLCIYECFRDAYYECEKSFKVGDLVCVNPNDQNMKFGIVQRKDKVDFDILLVDMTITLQEEQVYLFHGDFSRPLRQLMTFKYIPTIIQQSPGQQMDVLFCKWGKPSSNDEPYGDV